MAKLKDPNVKVSAGKLIEVENTNKAKLSNAKDDYLALWVEDSNGKNERCWLLTEKEVKSSERRSDKNSEDLIDMGTGGPAIQLESGRNKLGRIKRVWNKNKKHWKAKTYYFAVIVENQYNEDRKCLLFTDSEVEKVEKRSQRNKEDIPAKGFWEDLLD